MSAEFVDTNVILYLLDGGAKAEAAEALLAERPRISVQVLNEALVNCRRKAGMDWVEAGEFLAGVRSLCLVESITRGLTVSTADWKTGSRSREEVIKACGVVLIVCARLKLMSVP